ncbi:MAG: hypothetical protein ACPHUL_00335 [Marinomonas gallaica]
MSNLINRVYHPYWLWEEVKHNMWGTVSNRFEMLDWAVEFTGNHELYGEWMMKVVTDWRYSCGHNLSNLTQNRQAWIGHAACAYANQCPEDIVRSAWSHLSEDQQRLANGVADVAIAHWEEMNKIKEEEQLCLKLD